MGLMYRFLVEFFSKLMIGLLKNLDFELIGSLNDYIFFIYMIVLEFKLKWKIKRKNI